MTNNIEQVISLKISGTELQKQQGYNLRYIVDSLSSIEDLVDKTYLFSQKKYKLNSEDKENVTIRLTDFKEGSFVAEMIIQMNSFILPIVPLIADNPVQIWKAITDSYTYIKTILKAKKEGNTVNTELSDNYQGLQVVNNGSGTINIYAPPSIPELADKLSPTFNKLANSIDGDNVSSIEFKDDQEELVVFGEEEKSLFKTRVLLDEEKVVLNGKIINSNYANLSGQIEIYENDEDVPPGIYRFKAKKNNLGQENLWKKIYLANLFFLCQKRIKINTSKGFTEEVEELVLINTIEYE